jgi:hypothetical protein
MGPVTTILTLPVGGPLSGLTWIARQIANAANQQLMDPTRIEAALLALERRLEDGQIDEATFETEEALLLEELSEIAALRAAEAADRSADDDAAPEAEPETEPPEEPVAELPAPEFGLWTQV